MLFLPCLNIFNAGTNTIVKQVKLLLAMLHSMWVLDCVPDTPLKLQLPANGLGKA